MDKVNIQERMIVTSCTEEPLQAWDHLRLASSEAAVEAHQRFFSVCQ